MLATLLTLVVSVTPCPMQDPPAPAKETKPAEAKEPEKIEAAFERSLAAKDDAEIDRMMKSRPYEVIGLVDGYLESWLGRQEHPDDAKGVDRGDSAHLLELALAAAKHGDAVFKVDAYSRYANAWKGWTVEQRLQFREGQAKWGAGKEALRAKKLDEAKLAITASLKLAEPLGDLWGIAQAEQALGDIAAGEYASATDPEKKKLAMNAAIAHHVKAAQVFGELRHTSVLRSLRALGSLNETNGDLKAARKALEKMMDAAFEARRLDNTAPVRLDLARICRALGDEEAANKWESKTPGQR